MSNEGKKVKIHYTGTLDDGEKFDSSYDHGEPIEFVCMAGDVIPGFDEGVKDMAVGDKKTIHIEPADAYGEVREDLIQEVPLENIPNAEDLPVGGVIYMHGHHLFYKIIQFLAGKAHNFSLELVEVAD